MGIVTLLSLIFILIFLHELLHSKTKSMMEVAKQIGTLVVFLCVQNSVFGLVCYDCGRDTVNQQVKCNATTTCPQGQRCLLQTLVSSTDGHKQFQMRCGNLEECDGVELLPVGKRAVQSRSLTVQCCTTDLCNGVASGHVDPTASTCNRDIEVMLEDSTGAAVTDHQMLKQFLQSMVDHMNIGAQNNQMGLSTYDTSIDHKWDLDKHLTNAELKAALGRLTFNDHNKNTADIHRVVDFLTDHAFTHINGNRNLFSDSVVIFVNQNTHVRLRDAILNEQHKLNGVSRDVVIVVVGSGQDSPEITQLYQLASSSGHVLHVPSYSNLAGLELKLLSLLCH